jgi:hypothetical protein
VRAYAVRNVVLAGEIASVYKEIGVLYEPSYRDYALIAYKNAALVFENASSGSRMVNKLIRVAHTC